LVTYPSTNPAEQGLASLSGRNRYQKEKKISETGCESRERKLEEYENENYFLLW